jgi:hypothetical protein
MTTYLALVNKVLRRLRKTVVTATDDTSYSLMIAEFVQQATREVENAWNWNALRSTLQVTTAASDYNYVLTGAGNGYKILDVFNDTEDYALSKSPSYAWMNHNLLSNTVITQLPQYWDINGVDASGDPVVNFYPVPDAVYSINFNMVIKTEFSADTDATPVPELPIVLRATMHAIEERGDDGGLSLQYLQDQFTKALGDAIAFDASLNGEETNW